MKSAVRILAICRAAAAGLLALFTGAAAAEPAKPGMEIHIGPRTHMQPPHPPNAPPGAEWWRYTVELRATGGNAITLTGWRKCYFIGIIKSCEPERANFRELFGADRIPAGGSLKLLSPAWVWAEPDGRPFRVEAVYWGEDARGNAVEARYAFSLRDK